MGYSYGEKEAGNSQYTDKVFITNDHKSYLELNTGHVVYYANNKINTYQFNLGKYTYKMLQYLIENRGTFVPSDTLFYDVFGCDTGDMETIVDQARKTLCKIPCIKNSDIIIKKHSSSETQYPGYTIALPEQRASFSIDDRYVTIKPVSGHNYCDRKDIEAQISKCFEDANIVFLSGLSGIGKSELARAYGMHGDYSYILPLKLKEDGSGDLTFLLDQIECLGGSVSVSALRSALKNIKVLVIIDNYNSESEVIEEIKNAFDYCDVIITTQIKTDLMYSYGRVIDLNSESENESSDWVIELFSKYAGKMIETDHDKAIVNGIASEVGYHTMLLCQIALQFKREGESLDEVYSSIHDSIRNYLMSDTKVQMMKDGRLLGKLTPYELMKVLFTNKVLARRFDEIERQVLGGVVLTENYTDNKNLICELVGDNKELGCKKARNALFDLQEDHIVEVNDKSVTLHPIIKTLITDTTLSSEQDSIADTSYEFLIHILKNALVEQITLSDPTLINRIWGSKYHTYLSWTVKDVHTLIIPHLVKKGKLPRDIEDNYTYFIFLANNEEGGRALYLAFKGETICILDASKQTRKNYRYFDGIERDEKDPDGMGKGTIVECKNCDEVLSIPGIIHGIPITSIGRYVFRTVDNAQRIIVDEGIREIRECCFLGTRNLEEVELPDTLNYIEVRAFELCSDLRRIDIGAGIKIIGQSAFANCNRLSGTLKLPEGIEEIQRYAFMNTGIEELILPDSLTDMGRCCFSESRRLKSISIGNGLGELEYQLFFGCESLEKIKIPGNVKVIHEESFGGCTSLKEVVIEEGVERLENGAFVHCVELVDVWLPKSIIYIGKGTFSECPNIVAHVYENSSAAKYLQRFQIEFGKRIQLSYME